MGDSGVRSAPRRAPPPAAPTVTPTVTREAVTYKVKRTSELSPTLIRTGPSVVPQLLKRTNSDPSLLRSSSEVWEDRNERWAFIRRQPEYRRLVWELKVKQAFQEDQEESGGPPRSRQERGSSHTDSDADSTLGSDASLGSRRGSGGARGPKKSRQRPLTGILRTRPPSGMSDTQNARQVRFQEEDDCPQLVDAPPGGRVLRQMSLESFSNTPEVKSGTKVRRNAGATETPQTPANGGSAAKTGRKQHIGANLSMPGRSGVGQISLQMSDFHRPGITKTMSVNYSSSVLLQNSRILSEDLIRLSGRKSEARQAFVKRTERRLRILRKNRELREQTKAERDRRKRMEEDEGDMESAYFRRPEETLLSRPSTEMQELLTTSEKKEFRNDRIKERTMLLPENYRTANYIRDFGEAQAKTVGGAIYLRSSEDDVGDDGTIDVFQL